MMSVFSRLLTSAILVVAGTTVQAQASDAIVRPGVVIIKLKPAAAHSAAASKRAMSSGIGSVDQLNVQFDVRDFRQTVPTLAASTTMAASGASRDVHGLSRYYTVEIDPTTDVMLAVAAYAADPNVEIAEPDYLVPLDMVPNDPNYMDQWTHFEAQDDDIDTQEAWDLETGDSTVIVGVIDSGIQHDHPDLYSNIWVNPGEDLDGVLKVVVWLAKTAALTTIIPPILQGTGHTAMA
jgi:subtilisin family serine protease